jgi:TIR domain
MQDNIFINYRRQTDSGMAGRIYDKLSRELPGVSIFMDVDKLNPGDDFEQGLERSLSSCKVLLAVMGPDWANMMDQSGQRRLDNPDDFVRRELRTALDKSVRVIPVLVGGAKMPDASVLPADMKSLAKRQAMEIRHERFNADVEALAKAIADVTPGARGTTRRVALWGTGALALAAAVGVIAYLNTSPATAWLDQAAYQREFERQVARRYYPAKVEAKAVGKTVAYRAEFVPFPPSTTFGFHSRHSIPESEFAAFDARMTREGYKRQQSMEILVDNRRYHQGTWVRP